MHEEAMVKDLLRKVEEVAVGLNATRVTRVHLWVGALSHLTPQQLEGRWGDLARGTVAEGSSIHVEHSADADDPQAQSIILKSIDVAPGPSGGR